MQEVGSNIIPNYAHLVDNCILTLEFCNTQINYSVFNQATNAFIDYNVFNSANHKTPEQNAFFDWKLLSLPFKQKAVLISNSQATLVPTTWLTNIKPANILKFNTKTVNQGQWVFSVAEIEKDMANVYAYPETINALITPLTGNVTIEHVSTNLIKHNQKPGLLLHCFNNFIEVIYNTKQGLNFNNYFSFDTPEDVLYVVINLYKQLGLDTNTEPLIISGNIIKTSKIYTLLYQYIKFIEFVNQPTNINLAFAQPYHTLAHHYTNILA